MRGGTIVDATIIAAPVRPRTSRASAIRTCTRPRRESAICFGMKAHIGVDDDSGLVHHVECTAAT
ncbi:transposase [Xanthomonas oryzae]|uniref:transposase n=1 Tax=Xanthomonas oryzae TaxID=347 RepID=UPI00117F76BD